MSAPDYIDFYNKYKDRVNVICIYILEAHFVETDNNKIVDGWPIGNRYRYPQHKTLKDRIKMVKKFLEEFPEWNIPTFLDTMENEFNTKYAVWPDRGFLINNKKMQYIARVNDDGTRNCTWTEDIEQVLNQQGL